VDSYFKIKNLEDDIALSLSIRKEEREPDSWMSAWIESSKFRRDGTTYRRVKQFLMKPCVDLAKCPTY
jgi:hypothetical protein